MRICIESTIPSYVVARPARDILQAVRQQMHRLIESCGHSAPTICTPEEFFQQPYE